MKKNLFLLFFFTTMGALAQLEEVTPEKVGISSQRINRITSLSEEYVKSNKVPGIVTMVSRNGKIVYYEAFGNRGADDQSKMKKDDLFRIYSMTKPITAVAAMQLYEEGKFHLNDPVTKFIPEFENIKVLNDKGVVVSSEEKMTMQQLLTHTAGFSYGFNPNDMVDQKYGEAKLWESKDLDDFTEKIAALPLKFEPGTKWHYSIAVDLTGLIVERLSGKSLEDYFQDHIFNPLGMKDTFFEVPKNKSDRFLPNHYFDASTKSPKTLPIDPNSAMSNYEKVSLYSGGGGLVSTAMDYMIFTECLRNGGIYNGKRILGPKTVQFMTKNHLEGSLTNTVNSGENPLSKAQSDGFGFGLGFGIVTNSINNRVIGSDGEYNWGGAAGTVFWIDPAEDLVVVSMIQLMGSPWSLREDLKVATYQSLIQTNE
ncbi:MAG: serine hydrolase [Flavobacteriaceae bacterium]|nr:serine hydrolase [Flavobacteriaceae bacterium]